MIRLVSWLFKVFTPKEMTEADHNEFLFETFLPLLLNYRELSTPSVTKSDFDKEVDSMVIYKLNCEQIPSEFLAGGMSRKSPILDGLASNLYPMLKSTLPEYRREHFTHTFNVGYGNGEEHLSIILLLRRMLITPKYTNLWNARDDEEPSTEILKISSH